jgi:hypothetical protein
MYMVMISTRLRFDSIWTNVSFLVHPAPVSCIRGGEIEVAERRPICRDNRVVIAEPQPEPVTSGDDPEAVLRGVVHGGLVEQHGADVRDQKDEPFDPALPLLGGEEGAERFRLAVPEERGGEGVDRVLLAQVEAQTLDALLELLRRPKAALVE